MTVYAINVSSPKTFEVRVLGTPAMRFAALTIDDVMNIYPDSYGETCFKQLLSWGEEMVRVAQANLLPEPEGEFSPETAEPADANDIL